MGFIEFCMRYDIFSAFSEIYWILCFLDIFHSIFSIGEDDKLVSVPENTVFSLSEAAEHVSTAKLFHVKYLFSAY